MSVEHPVDTPSLEERRTSLTHVAEWALSRYGLGDAQPVLLDDSTNMVFRILPLGQQRHAGGDVADTADNAGFVLRIHALGSTVRGPFTKNFSGCWRSGGIPPSSCPPLYRPAMGP
jgi:hypothetical protein